MNNKMDAYFLLIVIGVAIGASVLISYMNNLTIVPMDTKELVITQMEFTTLNDSDIIIILHVTYPDKYPVTVDIVKINGETQNKITGDPIYGLTFEPGDSGTITIEHDWTTGNNYTVNIFTPDGIRASSYTDTA
jgi:hypothetical protein